MPSRHIYAGLNEEGYPSVYGKDGALVPFSDYDISTTQGSVEQNPRPNRGSR